MPRPYDPKAIEAKWTKRWLKEKTYEPNFLRAKRPFYNLMMFPYPSAEGLHIGSVRTFSGVDIYGRFKRMQGHDVFEPMGLDGFGIHSENYALKVGKHPADLAKVTAKNFYRQLSEIGNGFAWDERLETYDPKYYRWTQWIFVQMFKRGLAYRRKQAVNWCPSCKTVLADEQVISGECERCGTAVVKKDLEQWFFRITEYADRLLKNIDALNWSEKIKIAQKNWIGKSEGVEIKFSLEKIPGQKDGAHSVTVFTTRPDTLFGATFLVISPELADQWMHVGWRAPEKVRRYVAAALKRRIGEPAAGDRAKTGVDAGFVAVNPATGARIPVWVSDYVLAGYGTGAIMAVPAHDQRDYEFAKQFGLEIVSVIDPVTGTPQENPREKKKIVAFVEDGDAVLTVQWGPELGGRLLIGGTVEDGEDPAATARREIAEETGYTDVELIERAPETVHHRYFAPSKGIAFHAAVTVLRFRLNNKKRNAQKLEENERGKFVVEWVPKSQALREVTDPLHRYALAKYGEGMVYDGPGVLARSGKFTGMPSEEAKWAVAEAVGGTRVARYRLRDWLLSRQRYWGPPIPMIYCDACARANKGERADMPGWYAVPERELPVKLPQVKEFRPTGIGVSPLASVRSFYEARCPACNAKARRETDVSDTFLDSAWYFLRYPSVREAKRPWHSAITKKWLPVASYIGGAEHAVLHLLYARFLTMVFHDWGMVDFEEPFATFRAHGLITKDGAKMSKSKGNIVNPDEYFRQYGADTMRTYLAFLAPLEQGGDFRDEGIRGITRFLERVWKFYDGAQFSARSDNAVARAAHRAADKVGRDIEALQYNTAISALMVLLNEFERRPDAVGRREAMRFLQLLAPFAPFIAEELWDRLSGKGSIHCSRWPEVDPRFLKDETVQIAVQINGKVRDHIALAPDTGAVDARKAALALPKVREMLGANEPKKFVYVPGRIINIVI
ncbi:NUDIX domain-containing protein [Candidatus Parcubacteria bacterium]|nr:MAG: NUDIX domain-containing protein [Candidatus Parcubacteria bacterium]